MITKGVLKSIDYATNTCTVRIPIFEGTNPVHEVTLPAITAIPPGIFNGYRAEDVVMVAFENNTLNYPIIIGKLYLGSAQESLSRGLVGCETLEVTKQAVIPATTKLTFERANTSIASVDGKDYASYSSIFDIIDKLNNQEQELSRLRDEVDRLRDEVEELKN